MMAWSSWSEFFAMGGYGLYVWGSFGMTALVMLIEVLALGGRRKALLRSLDVEPVAVDFTRSTQHET
jgi:heme exporter protein D